jgi:glycosyltransferase involved in cell wall biosynthesis
MKILMVISQFYPIIGGAEKQAQLLAKKLIEKGIDVHVVTGWWNLKTPSKEIIDGIKIYRNFSIWGMFGIKGMRPLAALTYMVTLGIYLLIHRNKFDIIHVHQVLHPAFVSVFVGKGVLKKPVVVKNACSGMVSDIKQIKGYLLGSLQLKYLVKKMDRLIVVNMEGANEFKTIGFSEERITYLPNGAALPSEAKQNYESVSRVLTIARLDRQKGIDILLKAWALTLKHIKELRLQILGEGPLEYEFKKISMDLGIDNTVEFVGNVHNVGKYLKDSDLFILSSRAEGLSNALLEAMSCGIPCISTAIGGNRELFGWDTSQKINLGEYVIMKRGLLVNPDDTEGLSKAILCLLGSRETREVVGKGGRSIIHDNYSIDRIADKYIALYKRMLNGKP